MGKGTHRGFVPKDDPMFSTGPEIFSRPGSKQSTPSLPADTAGTQAPEQTPTPPSEGSDTTLKLDSSSIWKAKPYLATLSLERRRELLVEARRQEAQRWKEQLSHGPFYAKWTEEDWARMASSYSPRCLIV